MSATRSLLLGTASLGVSLLGADLSGLNQAHADTIGPSTVSTGFNTTEYPGNGFGTMDVALFNSSLGTLDSVSVTVTGYLTGTGTATNNTGTTQTLTYSKGSHITLSGGPGALAAAINALNGGKGLAVVTGTECFGATLGCNAAVAAHSTVALGPLNGTNHSTQNFNSSLTSWEKLGGGSTGLTVTTLTKDSTTETGGAFSVTVASTAEIQVAITYTYSPSAEAVPEPGSLLMLGTGLAGLGAAARRKGWRDAVSWLRRRMGGSDPR